MEFIQDYLTLVPRFLPPSFANPLLTLLTTTLGITRTLQTHLTPIITRVVTQPDVASILLLVALFFISLKILDMMYRAVMFWVSLIFRLALWGGIAVLGLWVWNRGVDGFVEDVGGLAEFWAAEYGRFKGEVEGWQGVNERQVRMKATQAAVKGKKSGRGWR